MALHVLRARVYRGYRYKAPIYNKVRGHTGVDLAYNYQPFPSPITGLIVGTIVQSEMGLCVYVRDVNDCIHVFAHFSALDKATRKGAIIKRNSIMGITGGYPGGKPGVSGDKKNAGTKTTAPHVHYEIVCPRPWRKGDEIMVRTLPYAKGFNTDPLAYDHELYRKYHVTDF